MYEDEGEDESEELDDWAEDEGEEEAEEEDLITAEVGETGEVMAVVAGAEVGVLLGEVLAALEECSVVAAALVDEAAEGTEALLLLVELPPPMTPMMPGWRPVWAGGARRSRAMARWSSGDKATVVEATSATRTSARARLSLMAGSDEQTDIGTLGLLTVT